MLAEDETEAFDVVPLDQVVKMIVGKTTTKLIVERIDIFSVLIEDQISLCDI